MDWNKEESNMTKEEWEEHSKWVDGFSGKPIQSKMTEDNKRFIVKTNNFVYPERNLIH
jgi:hypothetical protein